MKCKHHPSELGPGVCPSCLHDRLIALILAQNEGAAVAHRRCGSDPPPPVPATPQHRRRHVQRFFSTPQVGPGPGSAQSHNVDFISARSSTASRFSVISALFGRNSTRSVDEGQIGSKHGSSWISSFIRKGKHKHHHHRHDDVHESDVSDTVTRAAHVSNRGMSPDESPCSSGYLGEASPAWWRRPTPSPMRRSRGVSGFAVCLSPLVRAAPRRSAGEAAMSGELRSTPLRSAVGRNRSRKLADLGRFK